MKALLTLPLILTGLAPALLRAADETVLFSDDFATLLPGWGKASESRFVSENKMMMSLAPKQIRYNLYNGVAVGNADIRLKIAQIQGNPDQFGGIIFWAADIDNFYSAYLTTDGHISVGRRMNRMWLKPVSYQPREEVRPGLGQTNELRVVTCGRAATVFVNERQVAEFQGFPPPGESSFGVYAESGDLPSEWAFSELTVRQGPAPAPGLAANTDRTLLLADNFAALDPAWGQAGEDQSVSDNKLITNLDPKLIRHIFYEGALVGNADIRLKVAQIQGNTDQLGGVVFWALNHDNFYMARVTADGNFSVGRRMSGKWLFPVPYQPREEVRQGLGQENDLRVVTSGRTAAVYINETKILEFNGFPPEGGSKIGVYAESGDLPAKWAYSQLTVREGPAPSPETEKNTDASLLMADDFGTLDPAWGLADDHRSVHDNKLWLKVDPGKRLIDLYQGRLFDEVDMSVKVVSPRAFIDHLPGLIFWANGPRDYCAFVANPDGEIYAGQILEGKWKGMNILTKAKSKLRTKAGEINEMRVVTAGNTATFHINGQKAYSYKGTPPEGGSRIGLFVETGEEPVDCGFSEFRVRAPLVTPEASASPTDGLLLTDDFRALNPTWGPPDEYQAVQGNQLLLTPVPNGSRGNFYSGNLGNIDLRANVTLTKGESNQPAGVAFWQADGQNYYVALLRPDGHVSVVRRHRGIWLHPVPNQMCEEVQARSWAGQRGAGRDERVDSLHLHQRKPVFSFRGFPPQGGGGVGLYAESGAEPCTWAFAGLICPQRTGTAGPRHPARPIPAFCRRFQSPGPGLDRSE